VLFDGRSVAAAVVPTNKAVGIIDLPGNRASQIDAQNRIDGILGPISLPAALAQNIRIRPFRGVR